MQNPLRATVATLSLCAVAACASDPGGPEGTDGTDKRRPRVDAAVQADAAAPGEPTAAGTVTCYAQYDPSATCSAPDHCCFSNYSAHHNGECTTATCAWGTITCDGPEDCAAGETCCSTAIVGADGIEGYRLACQATACAAAPHGYELCHTAATCAAGQACVSAYDVAPELPRTLDVCR